MGFMHGYYTNTEKYSDSTISSMFDFLVQFWLIDLVQDIVVRQFDSDAFIKAYIVGVSV